MADGLPARADAAADLQALAAQGLPRLQRQLAALLRTDRARLITALYRLDVDEAQARRWLAAAARDRDVTTAAAGLAELIVRRLDAKLRTTAAHRSRAHPDAGTPGSCDPPDKPRCNCAIVGIYGNRNVREVERGEIVVLGPDGVQSHRLEEQAPQASCVVEYVYFARPDSRVFDQYVDTARRRLGETLADEHPADADIVIAVPDTANTAALGYANQSRIPYELGIIRNHYVGRTFMAPRQDQREFRARVKFNTVDGLLKGRRVVVVDDSLVRDTTLRQLLMDIRKAGAAKVHVRICSPPVISPCFYGMDFPTRGELIACRGAVRRAITDTSEDAFVRHHSELGRRADAARTRRGRSGGSSVPRMRAASPAVAHPSRPRRTPAALLPAQSRPDQAPGHHLSQAGDSGAIHHSERQDPATG